MALSRPGSHGASNQAPTILILCIAAFALLLRFCINNFNCFVRCCYSSCLAICHIESPIAICAHHFGIVSNSFNLGNLTIWTPDNGPFFICSIWSIFLPHHSQEAKILNFLLAGRALPFHLHYFRRKRMHYFFLYIIFHTQECKVALFFCQKRFGLDITLLGADKA